MNYFIAHRGVHNKECLENSLLAFKEAFDSPKWDGFECDVRTSLDGFFLICHNSFVGRHIISKTKYSVLKKKYGIVLLEDVLKLKGNKIILLELKELFIDEDKFLKLLFKYRFQNIYVMSFHKKIIRSLQKKDHYFKLGVLNYVLNSDTSYDSYDFICLLESVSSPKLVSYFVKQNIEVFLYGIFHLKECNLKYQNIYFICDKNVL